MKQYHALLRHILENGSKKTDRTGTGTTGVFGYQMRFNLADGFPLVSTKKCHTKSIIHELLWFLQGDTNIKYLNDNGVGIWDEWAKEDKVELTLQERYQLYLAKVGYEKFDNETFNHNGVEKANALLDEEGIPRHKSGPEDGDLGPVYGKQWRSWETADGRVIDQIKNAVERLKTKPDCRRIIVSAWNPGDLDKMALAPCHCLFQFNTTVLTLEERMGLVDSNHPAHYHKQYHSCASVLCNCDDELMHFLDESGVPKYKLDCQLYQRSADSFLGVPFNIASYALLTMMMAQVCNMVPGEFIHTFGDLHTYSNHMEQVNLQLSRDIRPLPKMHINPEVKDILGFKFEDFTLEGYDPHPAIKAPVAV